MTFFVLKKGPGGTPPTRIPGVSPGVTCTSALMWITTKEVLLHSMRIYDRHASDCRLWLNLGAMGIPRVVSEQ